MQYEEQEKNTQNEDDRKSTRMKLQTDKGTDYKVFSFVSHCLTQPTIVINM